MKPTDPMLLTLRRSAQSCLIPGQEIMFNIDDQSLSCISNHKWKTNYHPTRDLCIGIIDWRIKRKPVKTCLSFLNYDELAFIISGFTPSEWHAVFPEESAAPQGEPPF